MTRLLIRLNQSLRLVIGLLDEILYLDRYVILATFKNSVNARWMGWGGKLKEIQIQEKEGELIYHKNRVTELEKDIEKLKAQD